MGAGRFARQKGKRGERNTANEIKDLIPELEDLIRRGWQTRKGHDEPDIVGLPGFHVEVKTGKCPNPRAALVQAERDAKFRKAIPLAVIRDDRTRPFVVLRWSDLLLMIRGHSNITTFLKDWKKENIEPKTKVFKIVFKKRKAA